MIQHPFSNRFIVAPLACALGIALSTPARADLTNGLVDAWKVNDDTRFVQSTIVPGTVQAGPTGFEYSLRWGADMGNGMSGLDITPTVPATPTVQTNGPAADTVSITHLNRTMDISTLPEILQSVDIQSYLTLQPISPVLGPVLGPESLTFHVKFRETPNEPSGGICEDGGNQGTGLNNPGCADIFVTDLTGLSASFFYDLDGAGALPAVQYFVEFFDKTNQFKTLSNEACAASGASAGCKGFETPEQQNTTVTFAVRISAEVPPTNHVPEPGSLMLTGLALGALGLARRRAG